MLAMNNSLVIVAIVKSCIGVCTIGALYEKLC